MKGWFFFKGFGLRPERISLLVQSRCQTGLRIFKKARVWVLRYPTHAGNTSTLTRVTWKGALELALGKARRMGEQKEKGQGA